MRALVTGSEGFIGSHLCDRLIADGWDVLRVDTRLGRSIQQTPDTFGDLDVIYHLAAPVGPVGVLHHAPGMVLLDIIISTKVVAGWAVRANCRLVNVSTSEVYGSGDIDSEDDACQFAPEATARKEYALGKLAAETLLSRMGLDVVHVRPFNVAGPRQSAEGGFVIPRFVEAALAGRPLTVYQPGTQRRAFTHVLDVVDGLLAAYQFGIRDEVYNLGNLANDCSIAQLAREVIAATGSTSGIVIVDPRELHGQDFREAPDKLPLARKALRDLGWRPTRTRADIIADALR